MNINFKLADIVRQLNILADVDDNIVITGISQLDEAQNGDLTFFDGNTEYEHFVYSSPTTAIIVDKHFIPRQNTKAILLPVDNVRLGFARILNNITIDDDFADLNGNPIGDNTKIGNGTKIGLYSVIGHDCVIGDNVKIFPQVFVGNNVKIGNDSVIYPGVKIYHDCHVGCNCIIHSGAVIGSDGFGFIPTGTINIRIKQIGNVVIDDDVEIGANCTIDRATLSTTYIGKGVKMDNLIHIAHNVSVGERCLFAAQVGIAGSTQIGTDCMFGGQTGVTGHIKVGNKTITAGKCGITKSYPKGNVTLMGMPAFERQKYLRAYAIFKNKSK